MAYGRWHRWLLDVLLTRRAVWALVVALATLALLQTVFQRAPLARLPEYPAVIVAFAIAVVLPGFFLQRAVLAGTDLDPAVRLAAAPALGLAVAALPGFLALELHLDLQRFAFMYALVAAGVCGLSILFTRDDRGMLRQHAVPGGDRGGFLLVAMLAVVLAGVVTTPFWASGRLAGDFDDWTYMAYVREYIDTDRMNAAEPFLGTGEPVNPRMRTNVWVLMQALIADAADVPPRDVLLEYLRPIVAVFAVLATYALTRTLFRSVTVALLAAAFQLGYALLDVAPHEGFGRNLFLRISEDKMVGAFLLFPIAVLFLSRFVANASRATYAGFALVVLALSVVHPVPLVFLAATIASLGVLRAWTERTPRPFGTMGLLLMPVALVSLWPLVQRQLLVDVAPELFGTESSAISFRDGFHFVELGGGLLIGSYHMILHPLMLGAIALTPLVWFASRRRIGNQLVVAMTLGAMLLFFVPPLATPLARVMTPQTLWKVPWMVPVAPILAYLTYQVALRLARSGALRQLDSVRLRSRMVPGLAPGIIVLLVLAAALVVQEQYLRLDGGAFYNWTSPRSVLPGTQQSIFRGGVDRALSGTWRITPYEDQLLDYMEASIPRGSVVLVEPSLLSHLIPGVLTDIYPIDSGRKAGAGQRRKDAAAFASGSLSELELEAVVDRYGVDYIIAREVEPANESVRAFSRAQWLLEIPPYEVYMVQR